MHTATRLAIPHLKQARKISPEAVICCYGLYAPMNETFLRSLGVEVILGGEFEEDLLKLAQQVGQHSRLSPTRLLRRDLQFDRATALSSPGSKRSP